MDEIAVRIVGGGSHDWIMVPAQLVDFNMYRLLEFPQPLDCAAEVEAGDLVTAIPLPDERGNEVLVAHQLRLK